MVIFNAGEGQPLIGHLSDPASVSMPATKAGNMRFRSPEDILAEEHRRAKAQRAVKGGEKRKLMSFWTFTQLPFKRPTRLGPILSERFSGASARASFS